MLSDRARRLWSRTGWARLGRIAAALESINAKQAVGDADASALQQERSRPRAEDRVHDPLGVEICRRAGLTLLLDGSSPVDRWMLETGAWEPDRIAKLMELAASVGANSLGERVFLDIGAYFGLYALVFDGERMFDRVIAFGLTV